MAKFSPNISRKKALWEQLGFLGSAGVKTDIRNHKTVVESIDENVPFSPTVSGSPS